MVTIQPQSWLINSEEAKNALYKLLKSQKLENTKRSTKRETTTKTNHFVISVCLNRKKKQNYKKAKIQLIIIIQIERKKRAWI